MYDVTCEIKDEPIVIDTKIKTGTTQPTILEKIIAGTKASAVIKGNLCTEYAALLKAFTHTASTPYTLTEASATIPSYRILKLFAVGTSGDATPYDWASGSVMIDFEITGEVNGIYQFTSTWACKAMDNGVTLALTNEPTAWGAGTPFLFGNSTATLINTKTTMNSISLKLTKILADDTIAYQNSMTKTGEYLTGWSGSLDIETIYDDTVDPTYFGSIGVQTALNNILVLVSGTVEWTITTSHRLTSAELADPDKGLFVSRYSAELARDTDTTALTIAIT
jgi:hypothetical protein